MHMRWGLDVGSRYCWLSLDRYHRLCYRRGVILHWPLTYASQHREAVPFVEAHFHNTLPADFCIVLAHEIALHRMHHVQLCLDVGWDKGPKGP